MTTLICSIVIPVFNGDEPLVRAAIDSAAACLDLGYELIVVDSGSTQPVKQEWLPSNPRARLVVFADNLGLFANWNRALRLSQGQFVWALCADDRVVPETLWACVKLMKADDSISLVSTYGTLRNLKDETLGSIAHSFGPGVYSGVAAGKLFLEFYGKTWINPFNYPSGVMMRKSSLEAAGYFDKSMRHIGDIDLYFRMLGCGNLVILDRIGCFVTIHEGQTGQSI
ncbi:MAG: glycosyltransferase family 2 protein, partial [Proteobacteria bacterium]|nr:glycosyltransferase family 2 protein [Pseudomonadota bacterium]